MLPNTWAVYRCIIRGVSVVKQHNLVINWKGAPTYKLAQLFAQKIKLMAPLPNTHNLENTTDLLEKLEKTPILP